MEKVTDNAFEVAVALSSFVAFAVAVVAGSPIEVYTAATAVQSVVALALGSHGSLWPPACAAALIGSIGDRYANAIAAATLVVCVFALVEKKMGKN